MKKKQIIGLAAAALLFIVIGVSSVLTNAAARKLELKDVETMLAGEWKFSPPAGAYIAVVKVAGVIQEQTESNPFEIAEGYLHTTTLEYIDELMGDPENKGILLYVDSVGGTVYESEELYRKLQEYKEKTGRPVWDYMAHYAASGGYLISMAADRIYANPNTVTGSIGVIMSGYDLTGLYKKLGIRYYSITSGAYKDSTQMTDEQMQIYQGQVDEYYDKFVSLVAEGRKMDKDAVRKLADGRTYTAEQALANKLIDEISLYEEMKNAMGKELGTTKFYEPEPSDNVLRSFFSELKKLVPRSESQVLAETAAGIESGVPMYYAEQLQ